MSTLTECLNIIMSKETYPQVNGEADYHLRVMRFFCFINLTPM